MFRILTIDDDAVVRDMLQRALTGAGYTVVQASGGREGLRKFREAPADLIITDIIMPDGEGIETIRALRREFPHVKIITLSGANKELAFDVLEVATLLGSMRTFEKPVDLPKLVQAVRDLLAADPPPAPPS